MLKRLWKGAEKYFRPTGASDQHSDTILIAKTIAIKPLLHQRKLFSYVHPSNSTSLMLFFISSYNPG